ncbi:DUF4192 domain-containing protein [[Actinomadura] parvosata]|uniref:DUF4192 domain-containing protein n=1 Tax=[Actinomadura] parvosata TaxID=1955412 RepID=UPI00406CA514
MHHHTQQPTTIRLRTSADLIAIVPYLIGYRPDQGLVLVGFNNDLLTVALRSDLPDQPCDRDEFVTQTVRMLVREAAPRVALIGYGPAEHITPYLHAFATALSAHDIGILDLLRCQNGRYWSYLCRNPACCPPEGTPYDPGSNRAAAHAVLAGLVALPDKQALQQLLQPVQGQERTIMTAATAAAHARAEAKLATPDLDERYWFTEGLQHADKCHQHAQAGRPIPADDLAWLGVLLTAVLVRDIAYTLHRQYGTHVARRLWIDVTRTIDPAYAAAPATILAFLALHHGETTLARFAAERALQAEPDYSFARLILATLPHGIPPAESDAELDDLAKTITEQAAATPELAQPVLPTPPSPGRHT